MSCNNCPRKCNVDRKTQAGFCAVKTLKVAKAGLHFWEEPIISGSNGSGTIFFSGCTLRCVYCQNYKISNGFGKQISVDRLIDIMKELEDKGANNINLVTPTQFCNQIIEALNRYKPKVPVVYNTSGYESVENIKRLDGLVDVYLPDIKYSDNNLAKKYSNASNYFEVAKAAVIEMQKQVKSNLVVDGLMKRGLILRHLILPNAINNTLGVLDFINENFTKDTYISLMGQFTPINTKNISDLNRTIKPLEYKIAIQKLLQYGFFNTFIQDLDSASTSYVPNFDLDGV